MSVYFRQAFNSDTDNFKLAYGGHQYHASCANFWINCVEPKPPGLILPDLLWKAPLWSTNWVVFHHTHGWQGPMDRMQDCKVHLCEFTWRIPQEVGGEKRKFLVIPTEDCVPCSHFVFGICGEIALPKLHVAPEVANLSLVLLRCFQIWTTIICCCSIKTVKNCHFKKNKLL